jgi:hypothetical protein
MKGLGITVLTENGLWDYELDLIGSGTCPMAGFGIRTAEPAGSVTRLLVKYFVI